MEVLIFLHKIELTPEQMLDKVTEVVRKENLIQGPEESSKEINKKNTNLSKKIAIQE